MGEWAVGAHPAEDTATPQRQGPHGKMGSGGAEPQGHRGVGETHSLLSPAPQALTDASPAEPPWSHLARTLGM